MVNSNRWTLAKTLLPFLVAMVAMLGAVYYLQLSGAGAESHPTVGYACAGVGTGPTLYVDANSIATTPDGSSANPYKTIQAAVNAAVTNTTVKVKAGVYNENVVINKSNLALMGMAPGAGAVIKAVETSPGIGEALAILQNASNIQVSNLRVTGGVQAAVVITDATSGGSTRRVEICNNVIMGNNNGVDVGTDPHLVVNNTIWNNSDGFNASPNATTIFKNNIVAKNSVGQKTAIDTSYNLFFNNTTDFVGVGSPIVTGACNSCVTGQDPMFKDAANGNFHLKPISPAVDAGTMDINLAAGVKAPKLDFDSRTAP